MMEFFTVKRNKFYSIKTVSSSTPELRSMQFHLTALDLS